MCYCDPSRVRSEVLSLEHAAFESAIPEDLGCLTALETLLLSDNQLTGGVPSLFDHLASLRTLELHNNRELEVPPQREATLRRKLRDLAVLQIERPEAED